MGAQPSWSGLHMLRSGVQTVSIAPVQGGQLGGTWEAGWVLGRCWEGSWSTSIVPGGQELSRTQQESGGPFLKSDQLELLFSHPAHSILLYISSTPSVVPPSFLPFFVRLIHWLKCDFLVSFFMKWHSCPSLPTSHPLVQLTYSLEFNWTMVLCFFVFSHQEHIKVTHERRH